MKGAAVNFTNAGNPITHGTWSALGHGCGCEECYEFRRSYERDRRTRVRQTVLSGRLVQECDSPYCHKTFVPSYGGDTRHYCSRVCSQDADAFRRGRWGSRLGKSHVSSPCEWCGEIFSRAPSDFGGGKLAYCSSRCRNRANRVAAKYQLSGREFRRLWSDQAGMCAMPGCLALLDDATRSGCQVDHDHDCCPGQVSCGRCVRGLLCQGCNIAESHWRKAERLGVREYLAGVAA